jgi:hypothetical protein
LLVNCETSKSKCNFNTETLPDGKYEFSLINKDISSTPITIYIANLPSKLAIEWGEDIIDLSRPVSGRIVLSLNIDEGFLQVPPKKVGMIIRDLEGNIVYRNYTNQWSEKMQMGLRTGNLPNGKYSIYFIAEVYSAGKGSFIATTKKEMTIFNK